MSGPYGCTDSVEHCEECPRYMDDCDGILEAGSDKEMVVKELCPECSSGGEVRKGMVADRDNDLYVYRCKECGYLWDKGEKVESK